MESPHLLTSESRPYVTALVGNGEIVTTVGPTGYHTGGPWHPALEMVVWSGRRMRERVPGFIRMGCFRRKLRINGKETELNAWEQEVSPDEGLVRSRVFHEGLREETTTFVLLDRNALVLITDLENVSGGSRRVEFDMSYVMGDDQGRLPSGSVVRHKPAAGGCDLYFEIDDVIGSVGIRPLLEMKMVEVENGWKLQISLEIPAGGKDRLGFLIGYSDRRKYYAVPSSWDAEEIVAQHRAGWKGFQETSAVEVGVPRVEALRRNCLYSIRCNATPWSIPPAVLPTHWEGRTFHDELYPFLALLSGGHRDLASRIPRFRLKTLPLAVERSGFRGARYPWETTEDGREGGSYGGWMDEHFHMGQFVETAWQWCVYENDLETWKEYFPLFRECANYFVLNLVEEVGGRLRIQSCTDYDEAIHPVTNGLYTACAAIRCCEVAARVAERLGRAQRRRPVWADCANRLRENLPKTPDGSRYQSFPGAEHHHIAELGPVFPFRIDLDSECARRSVEAFASACKADVGWTAGSLPGYTGSRWMWSGAHLATAWALLGEGDRAFETIVDTAATAGPALSPCEQTHSDSDEVNCPWFTTAAGAFVYALHSLFVQVTPETTTLFPAVPSSLEDVGFERLAVPGENAYVSARLERGRLSRFRVHSSVSREFTFRFPSAVLSPRFGSQEGVLRCEDEGKWSKVVVKTAD